MDDDIDEGKEINRDFFIFGISFLDDYFGFDFGNEI